jgi:hypothetical protein
MFDDLDDPSPATPDDGARAAVAARARRLRRHRRTAWASGGTALLLVAAAVAWPRGPASRSTLDPAGSPTATESVTTAPATTVTPSALPTVTASPVLTPHSFPPSGQPTAGPTVTRSVDPLADGRPGWYRRNDSCDQGGAPKSSLAPFPDVTVTVTLPATVPAGKSVYGKAVLHNGGPTTATGTFYFFTDQLPFVATDGAGHVAGQHAVIGSFQVNVTIEPGHDFTLPYVGMNAWSCGDAPSDPNVPLPKGAYQYRLSLPHTGGCVEGTPSPTPTDPSASPTGSPPPPSRECTQGGVWVIDPITIHVV